MLRRLTIGKKLSIGVGALLVLLTVVSVFSMRVISTLGSKLDEAIDTTGKQLELAGEIRAAFQDLRNRSARSQLSYAIADLEARSKDGQGACSSCHAPAAGAETNREVEAAGAALRRRCAELRRYVTHEDARKALDTFDQSVSEWVADAREYENLASNHRFDDAHSVLRDRMFPIVGQVDNAAATLAREENEVLATASHDAHRRIAVGRWTVLLASVLSLLPGTAVLWLVFHISACMRQMVGRLEESSHELTAAAAEVSSSSQAAARSSTEQAASLEETSGSSKEIASIAQQNMERSVRTARLLAESQQQFAEVHSALSDLENAMNGITSSSGKISQIIRVIEEIAFQTNILALNAAVEAARAGEAGLGFSVVADEVRNLARRSAQAAKDTVALIEESIGSSRSGRERLERVSRIIQSTSGRLDVIQQLAEQVSRASQEQTRGVEQVAAALSHMDQVTQCSAATAEENARAGERLNGQSAALKSVVEQLSLMVDG